MIWTQLHPRATLDHLGLIPEFLDEDDPRSAAEQIADRYAHGGGWLPLPGWQLRQDKFIIYPTNSPEDRPEFYPCYFETILHPDSPKPEIIRVYPYAWVAVIQSNGSFEVARLD